MAYSIIFTFFLASCFSIAEEGSVAGQDNSHRSLINESLTCEEELNQLLMVKSEADRLSNEAAKRLELDQYDKAGWGLHRAAERRAAQANEVKAHFITKCYTALSFSWTPKMG